MMKSILLFCLFLPVLLSAREEILSYNVFIDVQADSRLLIEEQIEVRSEGDLIKRGIFRDFPVKVDGPGGMTTRVGFQVHSVERDHQPEPWRVENKGRMKRVYAGDADVLLSPGIYIYTFRYETSRQLGFFEDQDELYYNAIGTEWDFPVEQATVRIRFPENFADVDVAWEVWTGSKGSKEQHAEIQRVGAREVMITTTQALAPQQGLTFSMVWPKGLILEPTLWEEWTRFLQEDLQNNPYVSVAGGGLLLSFMCYFFFWILYGRDPSSGIIIPLYHAPPGVSPAGARYLMRMGYDATCFASTVVSLASKGRLRIHQPERTSAGYELWKETPLDIPLSAEEQKVFQLLLGSKERFQVKQANYRKLQLARKAVEEVCKEQYLGSHFLSNGKCLIPGILVILGTVGAFAWLSQTEEVIFLLVWLSVWSLGVMGILSVLSLAWKKVIQAFGMRHLFAALMTTCFAIPFVVAEVFVGGLFASQTSVVGTCLLLLQYPLVLLFAKWMKAPTEEGRKLMDALEGLKLYLQTAEVDRLHNMHAPPLTPEHFDAMLPYALALGVEQKWAETFAHRLASLNDPRSTNYHPHYYSGHGFTSLGAMSSALGAGLASNLSSAAAAPGGRGSGGGGSSGGGGGGGGGGGW
ncbi:DUF2207 domain-containing protein [Kiritimatiellota bacterium B12222]|nr:DUF2207 domain-containing protein [Kiritimatiellota bacterium B12222]